MIGEEERDVAMRAMAGLTGGCFRGDFCGAIAGAVQVVGCLFARANSYEMEDARLIPTIKTVYDRLKERAEEKYGDTSCRTISRCDWLNPEDVQARRKDGRRDECARFVGECAQILGDVLVEVVGEEELKMLQG
jgi:gas vesicle protein